jgi:hypothetical protein
MKALLSLLLVLCFAGAAHAVSGATEQVACASGSVTAIGNEIGRVSLTVINQDTADDVCLGFSSSLTCSGGSGTDGIILEPGAGYTFDTSAGGLSVAGLLIYCRGSGAQADIGYSEVIR